MSRAFSSLFRPQLGIPILLNVSLALFLETDYTADRKSGILRACLIFEFIHRFLNTLAFRL
jgi:hypothetical protein